MRFKLSARKVSLLEAFTDTRCPLRTGSMSGGSRAPRPSSSSRLRILPPSLEFERIENWCKRYTLARARERERERERKGSHGRRKSRSFVVDARETGRKGSTASLTLVAHFRRALLAVFARRVQSIPSSPLPIAALAPACAGCSESRRVSRRTSATLDAHSLRPDTASKDGVRGRRSSSISQKAPVRLAACTPDCLQSRIDALAFRRIVQLFRGSSPPTPSCSAIKAACASRIELYRLLNALATSRASPAKQWRRRQTDPQRRRRPTTAAPLTTFRGRPLQPPRPRRRVDLKNLNRGGKAAGLLAERARDTIIIARNRPWSVRGGSERRSARVHPVRFCVCVRAATTFDVL